MVENLFDNISSFEHPRNIVMFNGLHVDSGFEYVSSTYCNGIVNYIHDPNIILLGRYEENFEELCTTFLNQTDKEWFHTNLGNYGDDVLIFGLDDKNDPTSYILIWFDMAVSDCGIWRFDINDFLNMEHFIELLKKWLDNNECIEKYLFSERKPAGWIKF